MDASSRKMKLSNGICQGGILSPYLYNIHTNGSDATKGNRNVGYFTANSSFNKVSNAENMVLLVPTTHAFQHLVDMSQQFAGKHDTLYTDGSDVSVNFSKESLG